MIKSRETRRAEHVAGIGIREIYTGFLWEYQKERDHYEDLNVGGRIILKLM
jgi:hypothetical protein